MVPAGSIRPVGVAGVGHYAAGMAIRTAELLAIGTELTVGETRDTNSGDLARELTMRGVEIRRVVALPDDLDALRETFATAVDGNDLVVSTGGLGPTPDDLTREAIAAMLGQTPSVDPDLERWLRELFDRRRIPFPEANRKQAWLIPSAQPIPNANGTAPGWLVRAPNGSVVVALPGPPREMLPMWHDTVLPALAAIGLGRPAAVRTLRLTGIGESAVADRLGSLLDPAARPSVATYARAEAVDIRIAATDELGEDGSAERLVEDAERRILAQLGDHVWARDRATWAETLAAALDGRGWQLAAAELGLRGALVALLGEGLGDRLVMAEVLAAPTSSEQGLADRADALRTGSDAVVGLAVAVRIRGADIAVSVAIAGPAGSRHERRVVFMGGPIGRGRAAVAAAAVLLAYLEGRPASRRISRRRAQPATVSRT